MIALLILTAEEEAKVENVTNVAKSGISLVIANLVEEEGTMHLVAVVVRRRLGKFSLSSLQTVFGSFS